MCGLTKLECQVCRTQEHYVFHACESFIRVCEGNGLDNTLAPGMRYRCADLRWPLDPHVNKTFDLCDKCFVAGQKYFNDSSEVQFSIKKRKRDFIAAMGISVRDDDSNKDDTNVTGSDTDNAQNKLKSAISIKDNERLPYTFHDLDIRIRKHLIHAYKNYPGIQTLQMQSIGGGGRFLTLWIPQCPVCEKPTMTGDQEGIADLEFEPDSAFWTWLRSRKDQHTPMVQTSISTGFLQKVCDTCILRESKTRGLVSRLLERSSHRGQRWLIIAWLQSRGLDVIPFHEHCTLNVGVPDHEPPSTREIMRLMTLSWMRATRGLAFGDAATGETSRAPLVRHPYLFVSLDQWQGLCNPLADRERPPLEFHLPVEECSGLSAKSDLTQVVAEVLDQQKEGKKKRTEHGEEGHESDEGHNPGFEEHKKLDAVDPTAIGPFAETEQYTILKKDVTESMTEQKIWSIVDSGVIDAFAALRLKFALRLWYLDQATRVQNRKPIELMPQEQDILQDAYEVLDRIIRYVDKVNRLAVSSPAPYPQPTDGWAQRHSHLKPKRRKEVITKAKMIETMQTVERYLKATGATVKGFVSTPVDSLPIEATRNSRKPYRELRINPARPVFICSYQDAVDHADDARHVQWLHLSKPDNRRLHSVAMKFTCIAMPTTYWKKIVRIRTIEEALLDRPLPTPDQAEMHRREEQAHKYENIVSALI